jgi:predicted ester cyclase
VVTRYVSPGTHRGDFWGVSPTGRKITVHEVSIYRIAEGNVIEQCPASTSWIG